jgi:hypothetical protein
MIDCSNNSAAIVDAETWLIMYIFLNGVDNVDEAVQGVQEFKDKICTAIPLPKSYQKASPQHLEAIQDLCASDKPYTLETSLRTMLIL